MPTAVSQTGQPFFLFISCLFLREYNAFDNRSWHATISFLLRFS